MQTQFPAELRFNDWTGAYGIPVLVVGETPKRYRIEAVQDMRLAGRCRSLRKGETALVPRAAVRFPVRDVPMKDVTTKVTIDYIDTGFFLSIALNAMAKLEHSPKLYAKYQARAIGWASRD